MRAAPRWRVPTRRARSSSAIRSTSTSTRTLLNALRRRATSPEAAAAPRLRVEDFERRELDFETHATTVLLLDMSWSMSWAGRFPAAKRVALALDHLIRTRFPRDRFFVVGFSTRARAIAIRDLPELALGSWAIPSPTSRKG